MAKEQTSTSGNTDNQQTNYEPQITHIFIDSIYDENFDEEMDKYVFDFHGFRGDHYSLHLKRKDIERFMLFMRKADAEQKWIKHIINN